MREFIVTVKKTRYETATIKANSEDEAIQLFEEGEGRDLLYVDTSDEEEEYSVMEQNI